MLMFGVGIVYRCRLVRRTSCACSPAVDGSVLIVVVRESASLFPVQSLLLVHYWGWAVFQYSVVSLELNGQIYRVCVQDL